DDTNGDGRADRSHVFATGLQIPTGIELGHGGIYVGQGTELLHLRDLDGDGRADERRVVLSGFGNGDSHQTINTFVWSPGGDLFMCQGDGIESRVETPWGVASLFRAGAFRFRPETLQLEGLLDDNMGPGNPWGIAFDEFGQVLIADGAGGISFLSPALLATPHVLRLPRIGKPGGYCGIECIGSGALPDSMQGHFLLGDYHKNMVSRFALRDSGSGFGVDWKSPVVKSSHKSFRPVDVRTGPDGAIYVADWYNTIICHQDDSYRHPDRDRTHGRIWRLTSKTKSSRVAPKLENASVAQVIDALKSTERWDRYQAKRRLTTLDRRATGAAIESWALNLKGDDAKTERHRFDALGALETIEHVSPQLLRRLLISKDARIRAYASRTVGRWHRRLEAPLELLRERVVDEHPRVRMDAVLACAQIPKAEAAELAATTLRRPTDRFIDYTLTQTIRYLKPHWLPAFRRGEITFGGDANQLARVLKTAGAGDVVGNLRKLVRDESLQMSARRDLVRALVAMGNSKDFDFLLDPATYGDNVALRAEGLSALARAAGLRDTRAEQDVTARLNASLEGSAELSIACLELIGAWGRKELEAQVLERAKNTSPDASERAAAIRCLSKLGGDTARDALVSIAASANSPALKSQALAALASVDVKLAARKTAAHLVAETSHDLTELITAFLDRSEGTESLAAALRGKKISPAVAESGLAVLSAAGRNDTELLAVLNHALGISGKLPEHSRERVVEYVTKAQRLGDPARGELVFRSKRANCYACHRIADAGGWAGPDLSAVGTTLPLDRIVEEVLWPKKNVKEGYGLTQVVTNRGDVLQGYEETQRKKSNSLLLRDLRSGKVLKIGKKQIVAREHGGTAMPENVVASLTENEKLDLLRFLSELGRPGPFQVDKSSVVRRWEVLTPDSSSKLPHGNLDPKKIQGTRTSVFSRVSGDLHLADVLSTRRGVRLATTKARVIDGGRCGLKIQNPKGLRLWVDGQPVEVRSELVLELDEGDHEITFAFGADRDTLRAEWVPVPGSSGRVRLDPELIPR
ncbi:MAG: hypothetical protein AAF517_07180, partial [Planctomycetota bacterium]